MSDVACRKPIPREDNERSGARHGADFEIGAVGPASRGVRLLAAFAQTVSLLALAVVSGFALLATSHYPFAEMELYSERQDIAIALPGFGLSEVASGFLCAVLLAAVLFVVWKSFLGKVNPRAFLLAVMVYALVFQMAWVHSLGAESFIFPDTQQLSAAAASFLEGEFGSFSGADAISDKTGPDLYFTLYPFQSGTLFLFVVVRGLFGPDGCMAFQAMNAVANVLVIACLYRLSRVLSSSRRVANLTTALCAVCFPLLFSCALVYGNTMGLLLSVAALTLLAQGLKSQGWRCAALVVLAFMSVAGAMLTKTTCILFLIAMLVVSLAEALRRRSWVLAAGAVACSLLANQVPGLATAALEDAVDADFGEGMPKASWIAMGLREDNPLGMPGWWGFYPWTVMKEANGDMDAQSEEALSSIKNSLTSFVTDPSYGAWFMGTKLASEWSDPTFQTLYYSSLSTSADGQGRDYGRFATTVLYGTAHKPLALFMDAYQIVVCLGATVFCARRAVNCWKGRGNVDFSEVLLPGAIFLGFGVYTLWEAKSIYTLPFFVLMVPLAAGEVNRLFKKADSLLCAVQKKGGDR